MSLQNALLGLLSYRSMTGYDLKKLFDASISNFWYASLSQIYRELGVLEDKGFLTSTIEQQNDRPDKKIYSITETGRTAFKDWMKNFPEKISKEKRDEFTLRVFFGSNLSKEEMAVEFKRFRKEKEDQINEVKNLYLLSDKMGSMTESFQAEKLYWKFVLRRAQMTLETMIVWANECLEELESKGDK